jgi:hypothetical protein
VFEQTFKNIDDVLWKEAGCATELDYTEQTSWILFLKYLDDLERANEQKAELQGKKYTYIIDKKYRWSAWAAPKKRNGTFDHDKALTGDDLIDFVNRDLFPYLNSFRARAEGSNTVEYKIGEIFGEIKSRFQSGYSLRDALELMDGLSFRSQDQKHELSHIYEAKLKNMGNAGRNGGEYYTQLAHSARHAGRHVSGRRCEDRCAILREGRAHTRENSTRIAGKNHNRQAAQLGYRRKFRRAPGMIPIQSISLSRVADFDCARSSLKSSCACRLSSSCSSARAILPR